MTEDQIERAVERKFNQLDRLLMTGKLTQEQYDAFAKQAGDWADNQYRFRD